MKKILIFLLLMFPLTYLLGQSVSATYSAGDISTDKNFTTLSGSSTCPGLLSVTIPNGATITSVSVQYNMTAQGGGWKSEQRSQLRCTTTGGVAEATLSSGTGNLAGVQSYSRTGLTIANGVTGGGTIQFALHAGRTYGGSGCGIFYNKVDNNTWTVTVYYSLPGAPGSPTNPNPPNLAVLVPVSGNLTWTFGDLSSTYSLKFGPAGNMTTVVSNQPAGATGSWAYTGNVSFSTTYQWQVVVTSNLSITIEGPVWSFTTTCDGSNFPFIESFDLTSFPPPCWTNLKTAGTSAGLWDRQTTGSYPSCSPHSGAGMIRFNSFSYQSGTKGILVTPALDLTTNYFSVSFWFYRDDYSSYSTTADLVNVYHNSTNSLSGATLLGTVNRSKFLAPVVATAGWYEYSFPLPQGNGTYVIFEGVSAYGNNMFLDDVKVTQPSRLQGFVFDFDNNPIEGALISGGPAPVYSAADGSYDIAPLVPDQQYLIICSKTGYNEAEWNSSVPEATIANFNFIMLQPQMAVSPSPVQLILNPDGTAQVDLTIANDGNGDLNWLVDVDPEAAWITLSAVEGIIQPFGGTGTLQVTVDASLTPGSRAPGETYTTNLVFTSPSGISSVTVPVTVIVADPTLPGPVDLALFLKNPENGDFTLKWSLGASRNGVLDHYLVYRNGELLAQTKNIFYSDHLAAPGNYCYEVYAVYSDGAYSVASNKICFDYPLPPGVPLSNWALVLAGVLIIGFSIYILRKRI